MGTPHLLQILTNIMEEGRWFGIVILTIGSGGILISEAFRNRLSPGRVALVAGSAIFAGVVFWILPSVINYGRVDSGTIVPDYPIGGYR
ncbi:hypothetical protein [Nocardia sp. NBC_00511]|uniref:hypothetical protein n=1 Tax=Nocardia sp. NBC_00511 TaxID=2903591 RepID=UPI002F913A92